MHQAADGPPPRLATRRTFLAGLVGIAGVGSVVAGCTARTPTHPTASRPTAPIGPSPTSGATAGPSGAAPLTPHTDLVHGPRDRPLIALTFHGAGDPALARQVLHLAEQARARVTILAVGNWLAANRSLAAAIRDAGHELGNHTWSHQAMRQLDPASARREVEQAAQLLTTLTGGPGRWFRPSGTPRSTATIRAAARAAGYARCLAYDVDSLDYTDPGPTAVTRRTLLAARPGSIVSLHLGHQGTVVALPDILVGLRRNGLRPVTVSQLVD
jgi:peptidoglycan/xylan/chitin deacetylase (PgdA/CDA1 family)